MYFKKGSEKLRFSRFLMFLHQPSNLKPQTSTMRSAL
jgi:hypothetical protein